MALLVRPAVLRDAEAIAKVHTSSWQAAYRGLLPDSYLDALRWEDRFERWSRELREPTLPQSSVLVAVQGDAVAAFASVGLTRDDDLRSAGFFELYAIYVAPGMWARGAGAALLSAALGVVPPESPGVTLWVLSGNARARRFYERHGFEPDGTTRLEERGGKQLLELRHRSP